MNEIVESQSAFNQINNVNHKLFVLEYVNCRNSTLAYKKVYPNVKNDNTAHAAGSRLLRDVTIILAIDEKLKELWKEKEMEIGKTFSDLIALSRSDISEIVDFKDGILTVKDFDLIDTRAVKSINFTETETKDGMKRTVSIKMYDKIKAISELLRVLQMIQDKSEVTVDVVVIPANKPPRSEYPPIREIE